ncbi:MAG: carboxypeptidase regulatory-like domain-containing protein [Bacteroides sp.]|nr:carboxypeptidase regulatory-like domain-containing protein [Ruminococcus flavefaciens]MCM1554003.1 carboxypeptidase regulatory-like domain-containing protein [Bacteroides sp.]
MKKLAKFMIMLVLAGIFACRAAFASPQEGMQKLPVVKTDTVFYEDFGGAREEPSQDWLLIDANKDGVTWRVIISGMTPGYGYDLGYGRSTQKADDYAVSPLFDLKADRSYRLSYFANNGLDEGDVEMWLGTDRTVEGMTKRLDSIHVYNLQNGHQKSVVFTVPADGKYCIGVRAVSPACEKGGLYVDNIALTQELMNAAPQPVSDLVQVPGNNGTGMSLKWKNPTRTQDGSALSGNLTAIEIYRNYGSTAQAYNLSLAPGAEVTWVDPNPQAGKVTYHVYAVNAGGRSYAQTLTTFVGEDLPSAPLNVRATLSGSNVTVSWDEPGEFGQEGGWYDKGNLTYTVIRKPDFKVVMSSSPDKTCTDAVTDLDYYYYEVSAQNAKGSGEPALSQGIRVGSSAALPFHEDFEDEEAFRSLWTILDVKNDKATWDLDPARGNLLPGAAQYNWMLARVGWEFPRPPADDWLFSPLMKFEKGKNYRLRYSLKGTPFSEIHLRISLGKTANPAAMTTLIENVSAYGSGGFEDRSKEFTAPESGSFCLGFYYFQDDGYIWIDDVWVEEIAEKDLAAVSLKGSNAPKAGEANAYTFTIENKGTSAARNYKARLLDQAGNVLAESAEQTRPLSSGRTSDISLSWTPQNTNVTALRAEVVWDEDAVFGNNISTEIKLRIQGDGFKAVLVGTGDVRSYSVPWYTFDQGLGQTVYPNSLMEGVMGKLYGLSYQVMVTPDDGKPIKDQHFRVWVGETDRYDMSAGWFGPDELTCVLDTVMDIEPGNYEWYVPFQRAFDYKGGNIVVGFEGLNTFSYLANGMNFSCTETNWNAVHRSSYGNNKLMHMDNLDNLYGKFFSLRPNTTFYFDIDNMGALQGKVSDKDGKALANARVSVDGINLVKRTGNDGTYTYPYLPAGSRNVRFTLVGYEDVERTAAIADKQTATLDITMQNRPEVKVSGVIVGSDDPHRGLPLATLTLAGPSDYTVTTDENGCYTLENVYGNLSYTAKITASGYSDYAEPFAVGAADFKADTIVLSKMVNMPSAVNAYDKTDHALVEWTDPVPVAWLQLDKGEIYGGFGGASDQAYMVGHRYTPQTFRENGITASSAITKVRFYPNAIAKFYVSVFSGDEGVEGLVFEEEVKVEQYEAWCEHSLSRPVAIDPSKNYIVALKVQQSSGSNPVGFDRGPAVTNGDLFSENGGHTWVSVRQVSAGTNYNWLIHTYCSANPNSMPTDTMELYSVRPIVSGNGNFLAEYGSEQHPSMPALASVDEQRGNAPASYTVEILSREKRRAAKSMAQTQSKAVAGYRYEVYRLLNGLEQDQDQWTKITPAPVSEMQVRDNSWTGLKDTLWRYAVRSLSDGAYSDYTFSRAVDKGKYVTAKVKVVTNTTESARGAEVQLKGINNVYTATVGSDDTARIENVHFGTYDLVVGKEFYNTYNRKGIVLNADNCNLDLVTLIEDVRPPLDFKATDWVDYVDVSWQKPRRLKEVELTKSIGEYTSGYGVNAGGDMIVGQRFTPAQLEEAGVDGYYINSISFYPSANADFTVNVWKSDNIGEEKETYAQRVDGSDIVLNRWNTVLLDEPVLINASQSYIIGYTAYMAAGNYPIGADEGPVVPGGDLLFYNNAWSSFCGFAPTMYDFNWMIKAVAANSRGTAKTLAKAEEELDYTYELYRFTEDNLAKPTAWTRLSGENFKELAYVDKDWKDIADGDYHFAVFSRSTTGNTSDTVLSELLPKGKVSVVTVKAVTNNGSSAEGAVVSLSSQNQGKDYSEVIGANGSVDIPAVLKGSYILRIEKPHFQTFTEAVTVSGSKTTLDGNELKESLDAPIVRAFKRGDDNVRVDWYSPMASGAYPHYITWSTDEFFTGIGQASTGFNASCAHKYTPADLRENNVVGTYIYKIKFYPASQPNNPTQGSFRVQVWEGEDGISVVNQTVPASSIKYNEWNEVVLTKPYYIDGGKTVMVGYTASLTQGWGCGIDHGPAVRGRGNMISVDGSWAHITDLSPDLDYNWMIQAYCTDALEAGIENASKADASGEDFVKAYSVYRLRESDMTVPDRWTPLKENTSDKNLTDSHVNLPDAWYMYAVKAIYATGESEYAFSDRLGKGVANEGLEEAGLESLSITPNPNNGIFSMNLPYGGKVSVYALDGSLVWQADKAEGLCGFDLNLPAGVYTVLLTDGTRKAAGRLLIVR